ncbi:hypothetical protein CONLIGDRAFT_78087 [Coniochaeta ligniaria NRRL 30616]|uniref:Uncharacterized protein n=1 Tax=Coniochaeta ligniaria NRRL 30616 TaxID=1408157 RepID=A0A1J7IBG1_9PEZI|nr:hypothetical protein CONLIGDRAFT_78087 [Coniochaeta ligniaria NRRL 30616]
MKGHVPLRGGPRSMGMLRPTLHPSYGRYDLGKGVSSKNGRSPTGVQNGGSHVYDCPCCPRSSFLLWKFAQLAGWEDHHWLAFSTRSDWLRTRSRNLVDSSSDINLTSTGNTHLFGRPYPRGVLLSAVLCLSFSASGGDRTSFMSGQQPQGRRRRSISRLDP